MRNDKNKTKTKLQPFGRMKKSLFITLVLALFKLSAHAQAAGECSQSLSLSMGDVLDMNFISNNQNNGPQVQMVFAATEDYYNGIESAPQTVKIRSNTDFAISVRAADLSNSGNPGVKISDFIYLKVPQNQSGGQIGSYFSNSNYQKLNNTDISLLEDCNRGDNRTFTVQYKAKPGTLVDPGVYFVNIIYTATRY